MRLRFYLPIVAVITGVAVQLPAHVPGIPPGGQADLPGGGVNIAPRRPHAEGQMFVNEAWEFSVSEHEMATLALTQSNNLSVQGYARRMIDAQTRLQQDLSDLARQEHLAAPKSPAPGSDKPAQISTLRGVAFDRAYMSASVSNHEAAIAEFQNQSQRPPSDDAEFPALTRWAQRMVPTLNDELTAAQSLSESVGGIRHNGGQPPQ